MRISAALIVRNEEATLSLCLEALRPIVDEIVIVDTGSSDGTLDLARRFTDAVHSFEWRDDFSLARNHSIEHTTGDYVLVADADDRVVNSAEARALLLGFAREHSPNTLGTVAVLSRMRDGQHTREEVSVMPRFFRRGLFVFEGAIHEQLVPVEGEARQAPTGLQYVHTGYTDQDALLARIMRNRRILLAELARRPDDEYYLYQLGKTEFCRKDYSPAACAFESALAAMTFVGAALPTGSRGAVISEAVVVDLLTCLAYSYANLGRHQEGRDLLERHRQIGHPATQWADFPHALGYLYLMLGDVPRARDAYIAALRCEPGKELVQGTGGFSSFYHLGLLAEAEHDPQHALGHYLQALEQRPDHGPTISRCVDMVLEYKAALPGPLWEVADEESFAGAYVQRVIACLGAGESEQARILLAGAKATSSDLYDFCANALAQMHTDMGGMGRDENAE